MQCVKTNGDWCRFKAGLLTSEDAKNRREEISKEADFYGAMDGASKFVKGDAIAGILILLINIIGGLTIGLAQHDLPLSTAAENILYYQVEILLLKFHPYY